MTSPLIANDLLPKERRDYSYARARDLAFDAVRALWQRRRSEGMRQSDIVNAIERQPAWVSRNLRGPGNWTLRTIAELVEALGGELSISVHALEDPIEVPPNYDAYADYIPAEKPLQVVDNPSVDIQVDETKSPMSGSASPYHTLTWVRQ
jgi:hypothetical protein